MSYDTQSSLARSWAPGLKDTSLNQHAQQGGGRLTAWVRSPQSVPACSGTSASHLQAPPPAVTMQSHLLTARSEPCLRRSCSPPACRRNQRPIQAPVQVCPPTVRSPSPSPPMPAPRPSARPPHTSIASSSPVSRPVSPPPALSTVTKATVDKFGGQAAETVERFADREAIASWLQNLHSEQLKAVEQVMDSRAHMASQAIHKVSSALEERFSQLEITTNATRAAVETLSAAHEQTSAEMARAREDLEAMRLEYRSMITTMPLPEEPSSHVGEMGAELEQLKSRFDEYLAGDVSTATRVQSMIDHMQHVTQAAEISVAQLQDDIYVEQGRLTQMREKIDVLSLQDLEARLYRHLEAFAEEFRGRMLEIRTESARQSAEIAEFQMSMEAESAARAACQEELFKAIPSGVLAGSAGDPDRTPNPLEMDLAQLRGTIEAETLARTEAHEELANALRTERECRQQAVECLQLKMKVEHPSSAVADEFEQLRQLVESEQHMWSEWVRSLAEERKARELQGQELKALRLDVEAMEARQSHVADPHPSRSTLSSTRGSCDSEPASWTYATGSLKTVSGTVLEAGMEQSLPPRIPRLEFRGVSPLQ